ncbi:MAG: hypothetical protein IPM22_09515 [Betaproteobacteria bacterium]|nr:hypothetical protein [Betaproteobacteria bacterium]
MMRGVALAFPPGGIVIHGDSQQLEVRQFNLRLNLATDWLEVALEQLEVSRAAHGKWLAMHKLGGAIDDLFRREFKSAMQATVAAATFFEALYAAVRSTLPARLHAQLASGRGKSRRSALVAEQLKRAFGLRTRGSANVASVITEIYRFRDEAVHPSSAFEPRYSPRSRSIR